MILRNSLLRNLTILAMLFMAQVGYLVYKSQKLQGTVQGIEKIKQISSNSMPMNMNMTQMQQTGKDQLKITIPLPTPTIFIDGESELSAKEIEELYTKIITPYMDLYRNSTDRVGLVNLTLKKNDNTKTVDTKPFILCSTFQNGRNECINVSRTDGEINWLQPECGAICDFPPPFTAKYPQIVKNYQRPMVKKSY